MISARIWVLICFSLFLCPLLTSCLPVELEGQVETELPLSDRSFVPDFQNRYFLKDGHPYRYISGEFHYPRVLPHYWALRLKQLKAAGLDAVQTYVFWNLHEPRPGVYDFKENKDLVGFIKLAQQSGLLVILRVGPYVCAEWDLGGMPSWLLATHSDIALRSQDATYMSYVYTWLDTLLPMIQPLVYSQGGPVILLQYENEYGSFGNDKSYLSKLVAYFNDVIPPEQVPLFSTDENSFNLLKRGSLTSSLLATIDFGIGTNVTHSIDQLRMYSYGTPFVNSEFYTGWPDTWGGAHQTRPTDRILSSLGEMLEANGSVSFYMFSGGSNFGFMNGAEMGDTYGAFVTSYDYNAPISEGGDLTEKYYAIRQFISRYRNVTLPDPPTTGKKAAYGNVPLGYYGSLLDPGNLELFESQSYSQPLPMEYLNQSYGYIIYVTSFDTGECKQNLSTTFNISIQDRAHFYFNGELVDVLDRKSNNVSFYKNCSISKQTVQVVVENMGRVNYESRSVVGGHSVFDRELKGIIKFNSNESISGWEIYSLPMTVFNPDLLKNFKINTQKIGQYCFYQGVLPNATFSQNDTYVYIYPEHFSKGQVLINTFNLGRYWPVKGPQLSLYVPGALFRNDTTNLITLLETDNCTKSSNAFVTFLDVPHLG